MQADPQKATLREVALSAGVSLKTASRVLNNEPHVKPAREAAVRAAIKRLAYRPNELARGLKGRHSGVIGIVVPFLSHYFMAGCIQAIHHAAANVGFSIMVSVSDGNPEREADQIRTLQQHQVEGFIIFPTTKSLQSKSATELAGTPVVIVDQPTGVPEMDSILVANREAAQKVVSHLIGHGYAQIAVIGANRRLYTISERVAGYREAIHAAHLKTVELVSASEEELTITTIRKLFDQQTKHPRAVFTLNSAATIKTLNALKQSHLRVPEDVAIFGFDDFDTADAFQPSISVVSQPIEKIGKSAVELLSKRIHQKQNRQGQKLILAPQIVVRSSCGCNR
jgi:LacI family transcriptional regulator